MYFREYFQIFSVCRKLHSWALVSKGPKAGPSKKARIKALSSRNRKFENANFYVPTIIDSLVKREQKEEEIQKMKKEDTVKLISAEGFEFVVDKEAAMVSQTIHNMLTSPGSILCYIK